MGKGQIISGGTAGEYQVKVLYSVEDYNAELDIINTRLATLQEAYDNAPDTTTKEIFNKNIIGLQLASIKKRKENLIANVTTEEVVSAWCADLTEDLTGNIGTVEIPGENTFVQIQPGYSDNAIYNSERDGQLVPTYNMNSAAWFYNLAMLPGWQKWKPLFRYATITAIDSTSDTADITLDNIKSSQQELEINQTDTISAVPVEYMDCNSGAFEVGDEVLVKFENQVWTNPKIVGFKENPVGCGGVLLVELGSYCFVWNISKNDYEQEVTDDYGEIVTFPVTTRDIRTWLSGKVRVGYSPFTQDDVDLATDPGPALSEFVNEGDDCTTTTYSGGDFFDLDDLYDENGDTGFQGFTGSDEEEVKLTISTTEEYVNQSIKTVEYFVPVGGASPHIQLTTTTDVGGTKAWTQSHNFEFSRDYIFGRSSEGGPLCASVQSPCERCRVQNDEAKHTYIVKSPFADGGRTYEETRTNHWLSTMSSASANYYQETTFTAANIDGAKGNEDVPFIVVFAADQTFNEITTHETCGKIDVEQSYYYDGDAIGSLTKPTAESQVLGSCGSVATKTNENVSDFRILAYSKRAVGGDVNTINPFDMPVNTELSAAMVGIKDYYESIYPPPSMEYEATYLIYLNGIMNFELKFLS